MMWQQYSKKGNLPIKKMKKIRKEIHGLGFGTTNNSLFVSEIVGLPSKVVEVRAPPPRTTSSSMKVKRRKIRPKKINKNKSIKDEPVTTTLQPLNRAIKNNNFTVKRSKQQKRQFKNSPSSMFGHIIHRNILTQT